MPQVGTVFACVKLGTMFASGILIAYTKVGTLIACETIGTKDVSSLTVILRVKPQRQHK